MSQAIQTTNNNVVAIDNKPKLIENMAQYYGMDTTVFKDTVKKTCMPANPSNEDFAAFLLVANKYKLNPLTKEIYAFPKRGGGIQPIVGVDGWLKLINTNSACDGMEFEDAHDDEGNLTAITCRIYRKDRGHPTEVTEYMNECRLNSEPWKKWPARMLRHKAAIQCARYAFGFADIIDPDEADRTSAVKTTVADNLIAPPPPVEVDEQDFEDNSPKPENSSEFYEKLEAKIQQATTIEDVEQIWADEDVDRICADDEGVAEKIKNRRIVELEAA